MNREMKHVVVLASALAAMPALAETHRLADGESFTYELYLKQGFVTVKAGKASLAARESERGFFEATLALKASAAVEMVYHLDVLMKTRLTADLKPLRFEKHAEEGRRVYDEVSVFSYPAGRVCDVSSRRTFAGGKVDVGDTRRSGQVFDLVSLIFHARRLDVARLKPGSRLDVPVVSGVKVRDQALVYRGEEVVEAADGAKVKAGVFALLSKEGNETARFAFSLAGGRIPQRIDISLKFGSVSARLCPKP